jgi:5'-nucleotidase/UDP-sugar diphosphatase
VARRATKIVQERKASGSILLLDAGNSLTGDREPARQSEGATSIEAMNRLGYDAMALGPMDLALGSDVLNQRIIEARFPILSANVVDVKTGKLLAKPYAILEIGQHRVAVVGVSGESNAEGVKVDDPLGAARDTVAALAAQVDEVIVLSSAGATVNQRIADEVRDIDAIVEGGSGASAKPWASSVTGTPIFHADEASAGHAGRILGIARLVLDQRGSLTDYTWQQFALGPEVSDDRDMAAWVKAKAGN